MVISALICFANSGKQLGWATVTLKGSMESQDSTGDRRGSRESHYSFVTPLRSLRPPVSNAICVLIVLPYKEFSHSW